MHELYLVITKTNGDALITIREPINSPEFKALEQEAYLLRRLKQDAQDLLKLESEIQR